MTLPAGQTAFQRRRHETEFHDAALAFLVRADNHETRPLELAKELGIYTEIAVVLFRYQILPVSCAVTESVFSRIVISRPTSEQSSRLTISRLA